MKDVCVSVWVCVFINFFSVSHYFLIPQLSHKRLSISSAWAFHIKNIFHVYLLHMTGNEN